MTRWLTTAPNEFVADMIHQRLTEADIQPQSVGGLKPSSLSGSRDIYVEDDDLDRAREVLAKAERINDAELARESEAQNGDSLEP